MQNQQQLKEEIDATKNALIGKVKVIENEVTDSVDNIKDTIENTKEKVKEKVDSAKRILNVKLQTEKHPVAMLGGAAVAGLGLGLFLMNRSAPVRVGRGVAKAATALGLLGKVSDQFRDEIHLSKTLMASIAVKGVTDYIRSNFPRWADEINPIVESVGGKMSRPLSKEVPQIALGSMKNPSETKEKTWRPGETGELAMD